MKSDTKGVTLRATIASLLVFIVAALPAAAEPARRASPSATCWTGLAALLEKYGAKARLKTRAPRVEADIGGLSQTRNPQELHYRARWWKSTEPYVAATVSETSFPTAAFLGERWIINGQKYQVANVGTHPQFEDAKPVEEAFRQIELQKPHANPEFIVTGPRKHAIEKREGYQDVAEKAVLEVYSDRKGKYLKRGDLVVLNMLDDMMPDHDLLVVTRDTGKDLLALSRQEMRENLVATIRLSRFSARNPNYPARINDAIDSGSSLLEMLPMNARIREKYSEFLLTFQKLKRKANLQIGEVTRFAKFENAPEEVVPALILKLGEAARDLDLVFITVDTKTRRLFKRFGFQELGTIPTGQDVEPEFLMVADLNSPEFKAVETRLRAATSSVTRQAIHAAPPVEQWSPPFPGVGPMFPPELPK